jgi:regulator of ribosome biosynthesis
LVGSLGLMTREATDENKRLRREMATTTTTVVKAQEIAPAAYAVGTASAVGKEDDLTYDLGNLAAFDTHPFAYASEKELLLHARDNVQLLVNRIFDLPREMSDMGPLAKLPVPELVIPREKPLPKPKVETKWEKFAKEKGIEKKKKSRKVLDEATGEWSHAWGYNRANDDLKDWAVEVKEGDMEDPWTKRKQEKRARVQKNLQAQARNTKQGRGKQLAGHAAKTPAGIPVELMDTNDTKAKQRGKDGTLKTLEKVQFSTASMGKFDKMRNGEMERKQKGKRNTFLPLTGSENIEKERSMNALKMVLGREENAGKNKGKTFDDEEEEGGGRKGKKVRSVKWRLAVERRARLTIMNMNSERSLLSASPRVRRMARPVTRSRGASR